MWTWGLHGLSVRRELRFRPRRNSCLIPSRHKTKSLWTRVKRSGRAIFISLLYRPYLASSFVGSACVDWSYVVIYSSIRLDIWANGIKEGFQLLWHGVMTWVLFFMLKKKKKNSNWTLRTLVFLCVQGPSSSHRLRWIHHFFDVIDVVVGCPSCCASIVSLHHRRRSEMVAVSFILTIRSDL